MSGRKYFGTDGIRGKVGEGAITPEFVLKLGWAVGHAFKEQGQRGKVLIGKDTRISGYMFESALEAGLSAAGGRPRHAGHTRARQCGSRRSNPVGNEEPQGIRQCAAQNRQCRRVAGRAGA